MGSESRRKAAFKIKHPICCYCGERPTVTIDHMPARVCFRSKVGPEGFEFPACTECNSRGKASEQIVAFYIHALTDGGDDFVRVYKGLTNNYPWLLPDPNLSLGEKAKRLSRMGVTLPAHLIAALPMVSIPEQALDHFHIFAGKMAKALYFKHFERIAPKTLRVVTHWTNHQQPTVQGFIQTMCKIAPMIEVGSRRNTNIGQQFVYRLNYSPEHDVMVYVASFSDKIFFAGLAARPSFGIDFEAFLSLPSWREPTV